MRVAAALRHLYLGALAVFILAPLAWVVLLSLKHIPDAYTNSILPHTGLTLGNYAQVWTQLPTLPQNVANSVVLSVVSALLTTAFAALAGFAIVHLPMLGRGAVLAGIVASLFIPVRVTGIIGVWDVQYSLGLLNSTVGLVPLYITLGLGIGIFVMKGVFETIPGELLEAARIDGARSWWIFWRIVLPISANGLIVVGLTSFILCWGEYLFAATTVTDESNKTLPLLLVTATAGMGQWSWPAIAAVFVSAALPCLVLFVVLQRRYLEGVFEGIGK